LKKAAESLEKYARMYEMYCELFGDPGHRGYRIVGSAVTGVGASFGPGAMVSMGRLEDTHHIAHEMAHTWWGSLVSATGPGWKFLSEAMAEFSARWVLRAIGEEHGYENLRDDNILGWKQRQFCCYFPVTEPPSQLPVPLTFQEGYDRMLVQGRNYHWGPLVVNQIRLILGDEVFFQCLKAYVDKYRGQQAGIDEFVETVNTVSGRDMTSELKGLLWSTGFASYRVAGFTFEKSAGGYRTIVRIQNEGDYGLTCPLLLKTIGGETRTAFKVEARQEKELAFTTPHRVVNVVVDPDLTTLQYHPEQKLRLWKAMLKEMEGYGNNEAYGKSYLHYALGEFDKAVDPISEYLEGRIRREKVNNIDELLAKDGFYTGYVFMRGVFYLALDDRERAERDLKSAFPYMLRAMEHGQSIRVPEGYYDLGAIGQKDLGEYLGLLRLIAGREFAFGKDLDEAAKKAKVEEWKQWWEKEGKRQKLDLTALKEKCEAQRKTFRQREPSLVHAAETVGH
jgi:tetratricopeptide (TPR) repeat protein